MALMYHFSSVFNRMRRRFGALLRIMAVACMIILGAAIAHAGFHGATSSLNELTEQIVIKVFLHVNSDAADLERVSRRISTMPEVASIDVTSAEEALDEFIARYGRPSENLMPVNPFPITITAMIHDQYRTTEALRGITRECREIGGVEDAQFRTGFVEAVNDRIRRNTAIWLAAGSVILIVFCAMLHYTVKHHGSVDATKAQVLTLMGARRSFIAAPDLLFNSAAIILGLALGAGIVLLLQGELIDYAPWVQTLDPQAVLPVGGAVTAAALLIAALAAWRQTSYRAVQ